METLASVQNYVYTHFVANLSAGGGLIQCTNAALSIGKPLGSRSPYKFKICASVCQGLLTYLHTPLLSDAMQKNGHINR